MKLRHSMLIQWSDEDSCYLVTLPEFKNVSQPCTYGETYEEAAKHGQEVIETYLEIYQEEGKPIPQPGVYNPSVEVV